MAKKIMRDMLATKRLSIYAVGGLLALALTTWVVINLYVQSDGLRGRLEQSLGAALGCQVDISRIGFSPWGGITVKGVQAIHSSGRERIHLPEIEANLSLRALFDRRFAVAQLRIKNPVLTISSAQNDKPKKDAQEIDRPPPNDSPSPDQMQPMPPKSTAQKSQVPPKREPAWGISLDSIDITDGRIEVLNEQGVCIVQCEGVSLKATSDPDGNREGVLHVDSVLLHSALHIQSVNSPFTLHDQKLSMPDITATVEGGQLTGQIDLEIALSPIAYVAQLSIAGSDLTRLLATARLPEDRLSGKLDAKAQLSGRLDNWQTANGNFRVDVSQGSLRQIGLFQTIGQALAIEELVEFEIEEGYVIGQVREGVTTIEPLLLRSPNLRVVAEGSIQHDSSLNLPARLYIHKKIRKRLPSLAKSNLKAPSEPGLEDFQYLEFEVTGTLAQPKSNILERLVGDSLEDRLRGALKGIFGN